MRPSPLYLAPFLLLACEPTGSPTGPVSPPTGNALSITIEELQPSCSGTMASDVNSAAMVGGFGCSGSGPQYWDAAGNSVSLPVPAGYSGGTARAISEAGYLAGSLTNASGGVAARWVPGPTGYTAEALGLSPGGNQVYVFDGIDDQGNVLGDEASSDNVLVWSASTGWAPLQLPTGGTNCAGTGMSGNGAIAGICVMAGVKAGVYWASPFAAPELLPMLPGGTGVFTDGVNNQGTVVGAMGIPQGGTKGKTTTVTVAVRWDKVGGTWQVASLPTLGGNSRAFDVDEEGNIVGWSYPPKSSKKAPVLWTGGTIVNLGSLSSSGEGLAVTISPTSHMIAGYSVFGGASGNHATRWRF